MCAVVILFITMMPTAYAAEISMGMVDAALIDRGYPADVLAILDSSEKTRLYHDSSLHYVDSFTISYSEHTSTDTNIQPYGQISASDLTLNFVISVELNQDLELNRIEVSYQYNWLNIPFFRWEDTISVSWDDTKLRLADDTFSKVDKYSGWFLDVGNNTQWISDEIHSSENGYAHASPAGVSWYADLKGNIGVNVTELYGYGSFRLVPAHGVTLYEGESLTLYGHYVHPTTTFSVSVAIDDYGEFSPSVGSGYDERGSQRTFKLLY